MARINFDDDVESQDEFWKLLPFCGGDRDTAMGKLVRFFRVAQKAYGHRKPIEADELDQKGLTCMIQSGWAIPIEGGYRSKGNEKKRFGWYRQRVEAGESRAEGSRDEGGKFTSGPPAKSDSAPAAHQRTSNSDQLLSLSLVPVLSKKEEKTGNAAALAPAEAGKPPGKRSKYSDETRAKMRAFFEAYAKAYRERYGGPPEGLRDPAAIGRIGTWIAHVSEDRACQLAQVYLQIDHRRVAESDHDLWCFIRNLNKIGNALSSGAQPTGIDWAKVFGEKSP